MKEYFDWQVCEISFASSPNLSKLKRIYSLQRLNLSKGDTCMRLFKQHFLIYTAKNSHWRAYEYMKKPILKSVSIYREIVYFEIKPKIGISQKKKTSTHYKKKREKKNTHYRKQNINTN